MAKSFRVLYVASEIKPFLNDTYVSEIVRMLPQEMQKKGVEIRILVPRFGLINERKNRLHEVVRLSGLNITIDDDDKPLIIKVASIPSAKLQVYFIDNEDYFKRKTVFNNKSGKFHKDNDERILFFCRGVLETVIKLGWSPDIIHCNDWMSSLVPMLIKSSFSESHLFENTKCVYSVYDNEFKDKLDKKMIDKILEDEEIDKSMTTPLESLDYSGLIKIASEHSDAIIRPKDELSKKVEGVLSSISPKKKLFSIKICFLE